MVPARRPQMLLASQYHEYRSLRHGAAHGTMMQGQLVRSESMGKHTCEALLLDRGPREGAANGVWARVKVCSMSRPLPLQQVQRHIQSACQT